MKKLIVVTGPTASGKTDLAVRLALEHNTEIISADSRQIFRGIPIVTAIPDLAQRMGVIHHLMEMLPLDAYYSAAMFEEDALRIAYEIWKKRDVVVVCGGSMMYVDALLYGIDELPTVPDSIRLPLTEEWKSKGDDWLRDRLKALDPEYYQKVDLANMKRVFHAVEICLSAGVSYTSLRTGKRKSRDFEIEKIVIDLPREQLFDRINQRVLRMVDAGLEEEARRVYPLRHLNSLNTVGLKEMFAFFDGKMDFETALARIQKNTRVYAKKQLTWLNRNNNPETRNLKPET
ncbi:MAG: tRNA (adenosine(37)-N6)-dimethylallyltransferase MiaA [Muribaculaceae bacterium]|nr:tRNA (adenosine(37)-N6)-dimethylallyltransferase MiaA [Muribaculaceae bacterium]